MCLISRPFGRFTPVRNSVRSVMRKTLTDKKAQYVADVQTWADDVIVLIAETVNRIRIAKADAIVVDESHTDIRSQSKYHREILLKTFRNHFTREFCEYETPIDFYPSGLMKIRFTIKP